MLVHFSLDLLLNIYSHFLGISLSMAEASVAAPFTSRNVNISCVPYVIREGRATMVSAFASFKFGVAFCFTQLISVLMVFYVRT
jgi:cation-transporting ATPase 13A2